MRTTGPVDEDSLSPTKKQEPTKPHRSPVRDDETSSSGTSTSADSSTGESDSEGSSEEDSSDERSSVEAGQEDGTSNAESQVLPIFEISQTEESQPEPHPLETLFKRPKAPAGDDSNPRKPDLEVKVPFSFFDNDEDMDDSADTPTQSSSSKKASARGLPSLSIPQTPFTQRDRHWRSQRSAAPTPDTAAPSRAGFGNVWNRDEDLASDEDDDASPADDEDDSEEDGKTSKLSKLEEEPSADGKEESEFAKWFWEHRGETNRAWKKRRREAGKEKRQQANKRRSRSAM